MYLGAPVLFIGLFLSFANGRSLSVKLPDATYSGYHNSTSGLDVWLGVRYAAPPVGELRWRAAQSISEGNGVINSTTMPVQCIQSQAAWNATNMSEDSRTYFNWGTILNDLSKIHGGSWDHNGAYQFDPTPLINLSGNKFVAVILQYRLGAFGFLSGSESIAQSNGLNVAITAIVTHIPQSGGGTVLELLVQEGRLQKSTGSKYQALFKAAIVSSPWFPPLGKCSNTYFKEQFRNFTLGAGCTPNSTDASALSCLRTAPSSTLRQLNYQMNKAQKGHVNYWTACLEDDSSKDGYLKIHPIQALKSGIIAGVSQDYVLAGSNSADGSAPSNLSTPTLFESFLTTNWPLTAEQVTKVASLYPETMPGVFPYTKTRCSLAVRPGPLQPLQKGKEVGGICLGSSAVHAQDNAYEFPIWYNFRSPVSPSVFSAFGGSITNFTVGRNPNSKALNNTWLQAGSGNQIVFNMTSPANVSETYDTEFYAPLSGTKEYVLNAPSSP
ncbi:COesterase domain-containing protein [Rhizoctonia solani AG-1 IA]|uniref:COesterase domain-containing protein n=1 Tax=Thanatephorus cucumeris (strain AG1-IA) TaxID=983506 RepID=L8X1E9_THACA|nr:COesterase domain-containing protein [Rhizoctonia solani AG-1 IA]